MKISDKCYVIYGLTTLPPWTVNSGFIVGDNKTLVIDCGSNYLSAQTIYGYAKSVKPQNEIIALNTEPHLDHLGGNCFFNEIGIDIYGHYKINRLENELKAVKSAYAECIVDTIRQQNNEEEFVFSKTKIVNPNKKINSDCFIDLGGLFVKIILTPGHTQMNISVYVEEEKILFCGDVVVNEYIPNIEDGNKDDWQAWKQSLDKIKKLSPEIIVSGHGEILKGEKIKTEIQRIEDYLTAAINNT